MTNTFFTSDTHFGHKRVIGLCNRPFSSVEEMDETLIDRWNQVVRVNDRIIHLGDFSFHKNPDTQQILRRLNGDIELIAGNHDGGLNSTTKAMFKVIHRLRQIKLGERGRAVLCHFPLESWNGMHHGNYHFHGHCHGSLHRNLMNRLDVGTDCHNFTPVSLEDAVKLSQTGSPEPTDGHHTEGMNDGH